MKNYFVVLGVFLITLTISKCFSQGDIWLMWQYPSNQLVNVDANFIIRSSTNGTYNATNWPVIYNDNWTNTPIASFDGSNYVFHVKYTVQPIVQRFYVITSSNFWGESIFLSGMTNTPDIALTPKTKIIKN